MDRYCHIIYLCIFKWAFNVTENFKTIGYYCSWYCEEYSSQAWSQHVLYILYNLDTLYFDQFTDLKLLKKYIIRRYFIHNKVIASSLFRNWSNYIDYLVCRSCSTSSCDRRLLLKYFCCINIYSQSIWDVYTDIGQCSSDVV